MPRYSSSSWEEERMIDRYYEYLEEACDCRYGYDGEEDYEEDACYYCQRREEQAAARAQEERQRKEAALAANPWREQIVSIRAQLDAVEKASGLGEKLPAVRILLTHLLSQQAFIAAQPKFRAALTNKIAELRAEPRADPLVELFDHVDRMLEGVKEREDYRD